MKRATIYQPPDRPAEDLVEGLEEEGPELVKQSLHRLCGLTLP